MTNRTFHLRCSLLWQRSHRSTEIDNRAQFFAMNACPCATRYWRRMVLPEKQKLTTTKAKAKELKAYLDEHIIGQEAAKKAISVCCVQPLQTNRRRARRGGHQALQRQYFDGWTNRLPERRRLPRRSRNFSTFLLWWLIKSRLDCMMKP